MIRYILLRKGPVKINPWLLTQNYWWYWSIPFLNFCSGKNGKGWCVPILFVFLLFVWQKLRNIGLSRGPCVTGVRAICLDMVMSKICYTYFEHWTASTQKRLNVFLNNGLIGLLLCKNVICLGHAFCLDGWSSKMLKVFFLNGPMVQW